MGQHYLRQRVLTLEEGLDAISKGKVLSKNVTTQKLRLRTFLVHGTVCANCGLQGSYFAIEAHKHTKQKRWHMNLYGIGALQPIEILMTCDHKLARALGGKNDLSNTQCLCSPCNNKKSLGEQLSLENRQ